MLPDLGPIPIKERNSILFVERCHVDVRDGAFVMIDKEGTRTHVPVGGTACLYGVTEAAVLAAGYAPAIGFIHTGKPLSFVYDIADIVKFDTVVPVAFRIASQSPGNPERKVRIACRDVFRESKLLGKLIPMINDVLDAAGEKPPEAAPEAVTPVIPNKEGLGDDGHRG